MSSTENSTTSEVDEGGDEGFLLGRLDRFSTVAGPYPGDCVAGWVAGQDGQACQRRPRSASEGRGTGRNPGRECVSMGRPGQKTPRSAGYRQAARPGSGGDESRAHDACGHRFGTWPVRSLRPSTARTRCRRRRGGSQPRHHLSQRTAPDRPVMQEPVTRGATVPVTT